MEVRRRKPKAPEGVHEPLLGDDEPSSSSSPFRQSHGGVEQSSWALVPMSVNRVDWQALWNSLAKACRSGWSSIVSTISNCLATVLVQPTSQIAISDGQRQRLEALQSRIQIRFDKDDVTHQEALKELWGFAFPGEACTSLKHERWTEMGWQQSDPSSDFRGAGLIALENLLFLAKNEAEMFDCLLHKRKGTRSDWEYPFAVAGINLTFMLEELLDLRKKDGSVVLQIPQNPAGKAFLDLLDDDAEAFDKIYCLAFEMLDRTWLEMGASYMDFTSVITRVRSQLQSAMASRPRSMEGLKALTKP